MPAKKKAAPTVLSPTRVADTRKGGIRISITNQFGQHYRYRAQAVSLSVREGKLEVLENDGRCFLWFDHCDLEVRDARSKLLLHLEAGIASRLPDAEFVILAEIVPALPKINARRVRRSLPPAAAPLAN